MLKLSAFEPVPATQPDRLAVIAHAGGHEPAPPCSAAVLEIGCGDGANLLPLAFHRPQARFVGVEGSPGAAEAARAAVSALGLRNVEIVEGPLEAVGARAGSFDYVLVPGILSHVAEPVAGGVVEACARMLAPRGVAFVDHLGAAGRLLGQRLRDLLRRQVAALETVSERVLRIREILGALDDDGLDAKQPHTVQARVEVRFARTLPDAALVREVLSPHRRGYSPSELARLVESQGLRVLAEAWDPSLERRVEPAMRTRLEPLVRGAEDAADLVELMTGPRRRAEVLVSGAAALRRATVRGGLLDHGSFAARLETRRDDILFEPAIEVAFVTRSGAMVRTRDPFHKAVLSVLRAAWPNGRSFERLVEEAIALLAGALPAHPAPTAAQIERQAVELLELHALDAVTFSARHPLVEAEAGERPRASRLTRWQAQRAYVLTDPQHRLVAVDELTRRIVARLDGETPVAALVDAAREWFERGELAFEGTKASPRPEADALVSKALDGLARAGLLTAE